MTVTLIHTSEVNHLYEGLIYQLPNRIGYRADKAIPFGFLFEKQFFTFLGRFNAIETKLKAKSDLERRHDFWVILIDSKVIQSSEPNIGLDIQVQYRTFEVAKNQKQIWDSYFGMNLNKLLSRFQTGFCLRHLQHDNNQKIALTLGATKHFRNVGQTWQISTRIFRNHFEYNLRFDQNIFVIPSFLKRLHIGIEFIQFNVYSELNFILSYNFYSEYHTI